MLSLLVSSCTDDDVTGSGNVPLQVSVTANSPLVSRAIVTDEYLPDGSTIGVSIFAADGSSYDNQNYSNVKYTAAGTGDAQTWTGASDVSLSGNPATVVAYYPWQDVADLTAVPVETATQTDYMWAETLTGVANTNPGVELVMNHALTAVRVKLVLGDYTGSVDVSDISVSSPALGTAASLDVLGGEGALADITGQGDAVALDVDFGLTAEGTNTDVMLVPDASVTSGKTVVAATVGGKKFSAGIAFDEAYKQGYIYTYVIKLNNTGFEVTKVAVTPWGDGGTQEGEFELDMFADALVGTFVVPEGFDSYTLLFNPDLSDRIKAVQVDGEVFYGDPVSRESGVGRAWLQPGKHIVKYLLNDMTVLPNRMFEGQWVDSYTMYEIDEYKQAVNARYQNLVSSRTNSTALVYFPFLTEVYIPDSFVKIEEEVFHGCHDLTKIRFSQNLETVDATAFVDCSSLKSIALPESVKYSEYNDRDYIYILLNGLLNLTEFKFNKESLTGEKGYVGIKFTENLKTVEMPAVKELNLHLYRYTGNLSAICFQADTESITVETDGGIYTTVNTLISRNMTAPAFSMESQVYFSETGVVVVPTGATGYEAWLEVLPDGWSLQYVDDIDAKTEEIMQKIEEEVQKQEELKKQYAADYANGMKVMVAGEGSFQIFSDEFDLELVKTMFVTSTETNEKTIIDVSKTVTLSSSQLLTVTLKDATSIPDGMFKNVTSYFGLIIPEGCKSFGNEVFSGSNVAQLGFMAGTPPAVTESSLEGLMEENPEGFKCSIYIATVEELEEDEVLVWVDFFTKFPPVWQDNVSNIPVSIFKPYFEY